MESTSCPEMSANNYQYTLLSFQISISLHLWGALHLPDYKKIDTPHNGMTETGSVIKVVKTEIHTSKIIHKISFLPGRKQQVSARQRRTVHWLRELTLSHRCCWRFKSLDTSRCAMARMVPDASNDWGAILLLRRERLPRRPAVYCQNRTKHTITLCGQNSSFITLNKPHSQ